MSNQLISTDQLRRIITDAALPPLARTDEEYIAHRNSWAKLAAREMLSRFDTSMYPAPAGYIRRADVNESASLQLALEHLFASPINERFARLMAKELIPSAPGGIPAGATTIATYGTSSQGQAEIIHSLATKIPLVEVHARKQVSPVVALAAGFTTGIADIAQAAMTGIPIPTIGLDAAVRAVATLEDQLLSVGDVTLGLQGILRVTGATTGNFTTGGWAGGATADQICADVDIAIAAMETLTANVFSPNTLILPSAPYAHIKQMPRFAVGGPTVFKWLQDEMGLTIKKWWRCDAAYSVLGTDTAILFEASREVLEGYWPIAPELLAPEYHSTHYLTVAHARCGGVNSANPLAIRYAGNV